MLIPDNETAVDFLNYESIADTVAELVLSSKSHAISIGVHGDWGAGKSSVLKMLQVKVEKNPNNLCLWFNGWIFQDFEDTKTILLESIIAEIAKKKNISTKAKTLVSSLMKRVDWMKLAKQGGKLAIKHGPGIALSLATGLPSPDQIGLVIDGLKGKFLEEGTSDDVIEKLEEAEEFLKSEQAIEKVAAEEIGKFRIDFEKLLKETNIEQVVVLIDDLDRCLPKTTIEILEAIKLFLFVPKMAFIIAADEGMVEYAVKQHFPNLQSNYSLVSYAHNYLEKLIQVPFRIPALGIQETKIYIILLLVQTIVGEEHTGFKSLLQQAKKLINTPWLDGKLTQEDITKIDAEKKDQLNKVYFLGEQIGSILAEGTKGNPRQIKRFLNSLFVREAIARSKGFGEQINQSILVKLMLIERFKTDFYETVVNEAINSPEGFAQIFNELERSVNLIQANDDDTSNEEVKKWTDDPWLRDWYAIHTEHSLTETDLRPYIFVSKDKRILMTNNTLDSLRNLADKLAATVSLSINQHKQEVEQLNDNNARKLFEILKEKVILEDNWNAEPKAFPGIKLLVEHKKFLKTDLISFVKSLDITKLGAWIVKGWNNILSNEEQKELLKPWAEQDLNSVLKTMATKALKTLN